LIKRIGDLKKEKKNNNVYTRKNPKNSKFSQFFNQKTTKLIEQTNSARKPGCLASPLSEGLDLS
jgi:hypothetical protein